MVKVTAQGRVVKSVKKAEPKKQVCSDSQLVEDKKLGFGMMLNKGLEACSRKQLYKVAKKHKVKAMGKKTTDLIADLREVAKKM